MNNFVTSQIRTYVPIAIGAFVSWLLTLGIHLDANTQAGLIVALTGVTQGVYYRIAREIERRYPQLGVYLLGSSQQPKYVTPPSSK